MHFSARLLITSRYALSLLFYNAVNDDGVVHNRILLMSETAVMGVKCKQMGAEPPVLGGSGVEQ